MINKIVNRIQFYEKSMRNSPPSDLSQRLECLGEIKEVQEKAYEQLREIGVFLDKNKKAKSRSETFALLTGLYRLFEAEVRINDTLTEHTADLIQQNEELAGRLEVFEDKRNKIADDVVRLREEAAEITKFVKEEFEKKEKQFAMELKEQTELVEDQKQVIIELQEKEGNDEISITLLKDKLQSQESDNEAFKNRIVKYKAQMKDLSTNYRKLQSELAVLKQAREELILQNGELEKEIEALTVKYNQELDQRLTQVEEFSKKAVLNERKAGEESCQRLLTENERLRNIIRSQSDKIRQAKSQIRKLKSQSLDPGFMNLQLINSLDTLFNVDNSFL